MMLKSKTLFSKDWFFDLETRLIKLGLDSDLDSFNDIKKRIGKNIKLSADEFARQAIYVVLAGGFSQKTAKRKHSEIMNALGCGVWEDDLLKIFNNKNKIRAILKIWENRQVYRDEYYKIDSLSGKIDNLAGLPHIGRITSHHLARNLGENMVKYDVWVCRLGCLFAGKIDDLTGKLDDEVKGFCDEMFTSLEKETGLERGYIDVVLWKAAQNGLIEGLK